MTRATHLAATAFLIAASFALSGLETAAAQPAADPGLAAFQRRCGTCHYTDKTRGEPLGGNLAGFYGRKAGGNTLYGPQYSAALLRSGLVWDSPTLDKWLTAPALLAPGTRMSAVRVESPEERKAIIAYLETLVNPAPR